MQSVIGKSLAILSLVLAPTVLSAQTVTMFGALSNFDVMNDTGKETHGFEIEIHGASGVMYSFNWNRYGNATIVPFPNGGGVYVRYMAQYNSVTKTWSATTPIATDFTPTNGHQCVMGTPNYNASGCEHFGVGYYNGGSLTVYRWLIEDPNNPGNLIPNGTNVSIPAPVWTVIPPALPGDAAQVQVEVQPPAPVPPAKQFGEAQWMKTFKNEINRQAGLDELVAGNAINPNDAAHVETAWELLQRDINDPGGRRRKKGKLGGGNAAVIRRFELYKYTGPVDAVTGQALCADPTCVTPADGEVGDFIGAQNGAANLNVPARFPVTVTLAGAGTGSVTSSDRTLDCPGTCSTTVQNATSITLTAKAAKGTFTGWGGACAGTSTTCTINVNSEAPVTATFKATYKLVLKTSGKGSLTSNPNTSNFLEGAVTTLTATPQPGATFAGWTGGGCSGTVPTCTVTMNADTTVTATFK